MEKKRKGWARIQKSKTYGQTEERLEDGFENSKERQAERK